MINKRVYSLIFVVLIVISGLGITSILISFFTTKYITIPETSDNPLLTRQTILLLVFIGTCIASILGYVFLKKK